MKRLHLCLVEVLALLVLPLSSIGHSAAVVGDGRHIIEDSTGADLLPRLYLQCADNLYCDDDAGNNRTRIRALAGPTALYVCAATGSPCFASASNPGTSPTATLPCLQDALDKLPGVLTASTTIYVASGSFACASESVNLSSGPLVTAFYINKGVAAGYTLLIKGTNNVTANSFTNVADNSGTSSGSNVNTYPVDGTGAVAETTLNDTAKAWTVNTYVGGWVRLTGGTGWSDPASNPDADTDQNWYNIKSNTATQLSLSTRWRGTTPDATTTYEIYKRNNSKITASGMEYTMVIASSDNVKIENLDLGVPTVGAKRSIWAWRAKFVYRVSDVGVNAHQSVGTYAVYRNVSSYSGTQTQAVGNCGPSAYCVYDGFECRNFLNSCLTVIQGAYLWIRNAYAVSAVAGTGATAPFYGTMNGSMQIENTLVSAPSGSPGLLMMDSGHLEILGNVRSTCVSTAAGNLGVVLTMGASMQTNGVNRADLCNIGVRVGYQSTWVASTTPTYSGNTTNESVDASGTKSTTRY